MDKQTLAVMIPVLVVFFSGMVLFSRTLLGRAVARRIAGEAGAGGETEERVAQLEHDVEAMRALLSEQQERLDFSERMLAQAREVTQLPPAAS